MDKTENTHNNNESFYAAVAAITRFIEQADKPPDNEKDVEQNDSRS